MCDINIYVLNKKIPMVAPLVDNYKNDATCVINVYSFVTQKMDKYTLPDIFEGLVWIRENINKTLKNNELKTYTVKFMSGNQEFSLYFLTHWFRGMEDKDSEIRKVMGEIIQTQMKLKLWLYPF